MNILITGAAGFIGSHLCKWFVNENHVVIGVDNYLTGRRENLGELFYKDNFYFIEHDVIQPLQIEQELDWVMHFACPASPPKYLKYPIATLRVNSEGTFHLLELAKNKKAKFFLASTSEVYGDPMVHPQPESYWGNVNPNGIRSVYDEGKRYAEALTMAYNRTFGLSVRIIRIFNTYGPNMDPEDGRVVTNFITQAMNDNPIIIYGDGSQTRSFQFIDDLVEGIVRLMLVEYHKPINLGNPEEYNMLELAQMVKKITGSSSDLIFEPLPQDDPLQRKPDIKAARKLLNWEPRVCVSKGLLRTFEYFVNNGG